MEQGADLTIIQRELRRMYARGRHAEAGLLKLIAAGGMWTQQRKFQAGLVSNPFCPYCENEAEEDDYHFFWGCPQLKYSQLDAVRRTQGGFWCPQQDDPSFTACFQLRGIVPKNWTHPPITPYNENNPDYDDMVESTKSCVSQLLTCEYFHSANYQ